MLSVQRQMCDLLAIAGFLVSTTSAVNAVLLATFGSYGKWQILTPTELINMEKFERFDHVVEICPSYLTISVGVADMNMHEVCSVVYIDSMSGRSCQ